MKLDLHPPQRRLNEFAVTLALAGLVAASVLLWRGVEVTWAALVGASACLWALACWRLPFVGLRSYQALTLLTYPIGLVVSHVLMALVYFGILTPMGWLRRTFGRDPLQRGFDKKAPSYWTSREGKRDLERYFQQH